MRLLKSTLLAGTAVLALGNAAAAEDQRISYELVEPSGFKDFMIRDEGLERTSEVFDQKFERRIVSSSDRLLPAGQKLSIRILDVDMAGDIQPWRTVGHEPIRYVEFGYPPAIELEYTLTGADGKVLATGREILRDPSFNARPVGIHEHESFALEMGMLERWVKKLGSGTAG